MADAIVTCPVCGSETNADFDKCVMRSHISSPEHGLCEASYYTPEQAKREFLDDTEDTE